MHLGAYHRIGSIYMFYRPRVLTTKKKVLIESTSWGLVGTDAPAARAPDSAGPGAAGAAAAGPRASVPSTAVAYCARKRPSMEVPRVRVLPCGVDSPVRPR